MCQSRVQARGVRRWPDQHQPQGMRHWITPVWPVYPGGATAAWDGRSQDMCNLQGSPRRKYHSQWRYGVTHLMTILCVVCPVCMWTMTPCTMSIRSELHASRWLDNMECPCIGATEIISLWANNLSLSEAKLISPPWWSWILYPVAILLLAIMY